MDKLTKIGVFKDPHNCTQLELFCIPPSLLEVPQIQRDISNSLVKQLALSIDKLGFLSFLVVTKKGDKYLILDGQHRFQAGLELGLKYFPCIVVPEQYYEYILSFNTEKPPTIRDKSKQAYRLYREFLNKDPKMKEADLISYCGEAYYITFGIILEDYDNRFPVGFYEDFIKKIDNYLDMELEEAFQERKRRVEKILELNEAVIECYARLGLNNSLLKGEIIRKGFNTVYGSRVRQITDDFYTAIDMVIIAISDENFTLEVS